MDSREVAEWLAYFELEDEIEKQEKKKQEVKAVESKIKTAIDIFSKKDGK